MTLIMVGMKKITTPDKVLNNSVLADFFISSSLAPVTALKKSIHPNTIIIIGKTDRKSVV